MNPATQGTNATPRLRSQPRSAAGASVCPPGCQADPGVRPPRPDWLPLIAPLRLAGFVPHQREQRRQDTESADPQSGQPGQGGVSPSGYRAFAESKLSGRSISPFADPPGSAKGHHGHGPQTGVPVLSIAQTRSAVRRQGRPVLRTAASRAADPASSQTRQTAWSRGGYTRHH